MYFYSDLSHNNISEIGDEVFFDLDSVTTLTLSHSFIRNLTGQPFKNVPKLELLLLDENYLTVETLVRALNGTRSIHTLDLSHNMLTKVPNLKRADFPDLTNLWLGYNRITRVSRADLEGMSFLRELILKENQLEEIEHDAFAETPNITLLDIDGSRLSVLPNLMYMSNLRTLHLNRGRLTELPANMCQGHRRLSILEVENNLLSEIPSFSMCRPGLVIGNFAYNRIQTLQKDTFANQGILRDLRLGNNMLTVLPDGLLDDTVELEYFDVSDNRLTSLSPQLFENLVSLVRFDASHNAIQKLERGLFKNNTEMDILLLNDNQISDIDDYSFPEYSELRRLDLSDNVFSSWKLPSSGFPYLAHLVLKGLPRLFKVPNRLETPRIREVVYTYPYHCCIWRDYTRDIVYHDDETLDSTEIPPTMISESSDPTLPPDWSSCPPEKHREKGRLDDISEHWNIVVLVLPGCKLQVVDRSDGGTDEVEVGTSEEEEFAVLLDRFTSKFGLETPVDYTEDVICLPEPDALNPCDNLMDPMFLRVAIWAIWVIALLGNGTVLFVAIAALEKLETYQFIICNLAIADFFMGVYLAFLAIVDIRTFGHESFYQSALSWQFGPGCQTAGFIAVFASELSMYMLVMLTLERVYTISYVFNQNERKKMKVAILFTIIGWLFALFLATLPLIGINSYTEVAVCLPYMTSSWYDKAYIGFLLSINLLGFLVILGSYVYIFCRIRKSPAQPPTKKGTIVVAVLKIAVLIVSALICWVPIAVIGYAALTGRSLVTVYEAKFFIVFVYPFNACINPFIYAIFTRHFRHKIGSIFKRTKDKVTSFPPQHSLRLQHRNNAIMSDRVNSPRGNPSPEELRKMRQNRRSNSFSLQYVAPATAVVQCPLPTTRVSPPAGVYMGRRSSLPAAFGSTLSACTPCGHSSGAANPSLPFRLGPLYSSDNSSLPNLQEETELTEPPPQVDVEQTTLTGSQDSSLRRLSIVEEEEEVEETEGTTKSVELESVSVSSSDSEDYADASDHPIDVVVIEKSTDLDDVVRVTTAGTPIRIEPERRTCTAEGCREAKNTLTPVGNAKSLTGSTQSTSSLQEVVVVEQHPETEVLGTELDRQSRAERGTSKLSTDSTCSGYSSSALDDAYSKVDGESRTISERKVSGDEDSPESQRPSSKCFQDARSQATLGDVASIDSGSCHDLAIALSKSSSAESQGSADSSNSNSNDSDNHHKNSLYSTVDQESRSHSHSSKSHSQTGFSNPTFCAELSETDRQSGKNHSTNSLGVTKSETEV